MGELIRILGRFGRDRRGVTATEYGIIISALAFTLVLIFTKLSTPIAAVLTNVGSSI